MDVITMSKFQSIYFCYKSPGFLHPVNQITKPSDIETKYDGTESALNEMLTEHINIAVR